MIKNRTHPKLSILLAISALVLLSACTSKVAYRFLDWTIEWSVNDYVDWTSPQQKAFNIALDNTVDWHQSTQLPRYSIFLRQFAQDIQSPITEQRLEKEIDQIGLFWQDIMLEVTPKAARLLTRLDDEQADDILENIEDNNRKRKKKYLRMNPQQRHSARIKSTSKFAKRFIGSLSKEQKLLISGWAESVNDTRPEWAASRSNWVDSFRRALSDRTEPGFEGKIERLFVNSDSFWSSDYQEKYTGNKLHAIRLVIALQKSLSDRQQKKLQRELHDWADNFAELSQEKNRS